MKRILHKFLALLMSALMVVGILPLPAFAADETLYVSRNGDDAGDGTQAAPYATLAAAYAAAPDGSQIIVIDNISLASKVTFDEDKSVTISGVSNVTATYTGEDNIGNEADGLIAVLAGHVTLRDITIQMPTEMGPNGRVLYVGPAGSVTLESGAALANGYLAYSGGGVQVDGGSLTMMDGAEIKDCYVANNMNCYGGGVSVVNGGTFRMSGGSISDNAIHSIQDFGSYGGGVAVDGTSTFLMSGGRISDNVVDTLGGGVYLQQGAVMELVGDVEIMGNIADIADNNLCLPDERVQLQITGTVSGSVGLNCGEADYNMVVGVPAGGYTILALDEGSFVYDGGAYDIRLKEDNLVLYQYTVPVDLKLDGVDSSNTDEETILREDYDTTLIAQDGYLLPGEITVLVGGAELDEDSYTYDPETGEIHIPGKLVAGTVEITATGDAIHTVEVITSHVSADVMSAEVISKDTTTITLTAADRYALPSEDDIVIEGTCDWEYNAGTLTLANVQSDLIVTINGAEVYHTIYFDPGDGECDPASKLLPESQATYGELPTPFLEGYTFSGWYAGNVLVTADTANKLTGDLTLAARWTQKTDVTYTIQHWVEYVDSGLNPGYQGGSLTTVTYNGVTHKYYLHTAVTGEDGIANGRLTLTNRVLAFLGGGLSMDGITANGANVYDAIVSPDGSSVFPLFYDRNNYFVKFDANSGSMDASGVTANVYYGGRYGLLPPASRPGYSLIGWFTEAHGGAEVQTGDNYTQTSDQILYAHWAPVGTTPYTVYHLYQNLNGNTVSYDQTPEAYSVQGTDHLTGTSDTTVDIYTIAIPGFIPSKDNSYTLKIKADGSAAAYLYYDRLATDVSFDSNGGSAVSMITRLYYGGTFSVLPAAPVRDGYTFSGWVDGPGATDRQVTIGTEINAINPNCLAKLTLYAHWTPRTYGLTFEAHGGVLSGPKTVTYGQAVGELPTATLTGYVFAGWYDQDGKLGEPEGNLITADTVVSTETIIQATEGMETPKTLYAWYNPVQVTLIFDPAPGKLSGDSTLQVIYDKTFGSAGAIPTPIREGYTLRAWHLGAEDGPVLSAQAISKLTADTTAYAEYAPNIYVVHLDVAGGEPLSQSTILATYDAPYGELPAPKRTGYAFLGWFDKAGTEVKAESIVKITDAQTLTARWKALEYTVSFDVNGGDALNEQSRSKIIAYGAEYGPLPTPTRPGSYTFNGWFTEKEAGIKVTSDTVVTATANHSLYAHWRSSGGSGGGGGASLPTEYTLTFDSNGGAKVASITAVRNTKIDLSKYSTTRNGYRFSGWFTDRELTQAAGGILTIKADTTLYAAWEQASSGMNSMLNRTDHSAYLMGLPDGTIRPTANITRAEVAQIFYRLLTTEAHSRYDTSSNDFDDSTEADWFNVAVSTMANMGVLQGRDSRKFEPSADITRAEFAAITARFCDDPYDGADLFSDIADSWAHKEINQAASAGWLQGDGTGSFRPDDKMTRAEAVTLINRMLGRLPESIKAIGFGMKVWPDNLDTQIWYYLPIQEATNSHDYKISEDGIHEFWTAIKK